MAQKNFRAMAQTHIFWGFKQWLEPTFDMQILTSNIVEVGDFWLLPTLGQTITYNCYSGVNA